MGDRFIENQILQIKQTIEPQKIIIDIEKEIRQELLQEANQFLTELTTLKDSN